MPNLGKFIGAGLDKIFKKKVAKGAAAKGKRNAAEATEADKSELVTMERLLVKTTNEKTKAELKAKIQRLKAKQKPAEKAKVAPTKEYVITDKIIKKKYEVGGEVLNTVKAGINKLKKKPTPVNKSARNDSTASGKTHQATDLKLPNSLKPQAGVLDSEVDASKTKTPNIFKKQAQ
jgi:hypothetical protein